jgi:hypothetical protein
VDACVDDREGLVEQWVISGPAIAVACSRISTEAGTTILAIESVAKDDLEALALTT